MQCNVSYFTSLNTPTRPFRNTLIALLAIRAFVYGYFPFFVREKLASSPKCVAHHAITLCQSYGLRQILLPVILYSS